MKRPASYNTKQGDAVLSCLASVKGNFITASQIEDHLRMERVVISRPTIYRQLDKLVGDGKIRRYLFEDSPVACYRYVDPDNNERDVYHLKCEVCDGVFNLKCDEVGHVSRHISSSHGFQVNESKTVFYGRCGACRQDG